MKFTPTMPRACCWSIASLSHIRTCRTISLGSPLGPVWNLNPSHPCASLSPLKALVATVSAKTKKFVRSPRVGERRSTRSWYSWSSISFRRSRETYRGAFP